MEAKEVIEKFPEIFDKNVGGDWSIPKGWVGIVDHLCTLIQYHCLQDEWIDNPEYDEGSEYNIDDIRTHKRIRTPRKQVICNQVKEKFGGLRFYTSYADDYVTGLISFACHLSRITCVFCSSTEDVKMTKKGWIEPYCKECMKKFSRDEDDNTG